ncbi:MAG: HdeD family acid-resistance protein [Desulfarculaceae bacterium]|nr:HdeD family acid-resistance protein [Desulfarculaceae bacterium]MCF8048916.1 HdeD family acid-resistance protein [Desulfarculaceae bacterium]MCF8064465.1 HdeD family acid-resistance protein [Desulfarculaceae bacterium]MCF8099497.1 HdeD family acid-resistance protein [Desulfarculaceae bacterium]MCF8123105.1 HdeD family acid-resistance protein [Desulfarculaceae bacterium]
MSAQTSQAGGGLLKDGLAELQKHRGSLLAAGVISLILGTIAILAPLAATVAVVWVIGAVILVQGIIQLVHCFKSAQWSVFAWNLLWAVVYVIAGGLILARPLLGAVTLTLLLAAFFIVSGVVKLGLAMKLKPAPRWGWVFFSGIMGLVLGLIIFAGWPGDSLAIMGLLLGIDLIFGGWSMIMLASAGKSA